MPKLTIPFNDSINNELTYLHAADEVKGALEAIHKVVQKEDPSLEIEWKPVNGKNTHRFVFIKGDSEEVLEFNHTNLCDMLGTKEIYKKMVEDIKNVAEILEQKYEANMSETRLRVLTYLKKLNDKDPGSYKPTANLATTLDVETRKIINCIKYFESQGFVAVRWIDSTTGMVTISGNGIAYLTETRQKEQLPALVKEQKYAIKKERFEPKSKYDIGKKYKCFVIMPIGQKDTIEYENNMMIYQDIFKPCVESCGYDIQCGRSDLIGEPGAIPQQIIDALYNADIILADLRRQNPNVIWELGVRHAFFKRSILVVSDVSQNFFDTLIYRLAEYKIDGRSNADFFKQINSFIKDIIEQPKKPDNPVMNFTPANYMSSALSGSGSPKDAFLNTEPDKAKVYIGYLDKSVANDTQWYTLQFGVQNLMRKSPENVHVEISFPAEYAESKKWGTEPFRGQVETDPSTGLKYLRLHFNYEAIAIETRRKHFDRFLLPGKTLWVLGGQPSPAITDLNFFVNNSNKENRQKYSVKWEVFYSSGELVSTGEVPFEKLQKLV